MTAGAPLQTGADVAQHSALVTAQQSLERLATALQSCDLNDLAACAPGIDATARDLRHVDARRLAATPGAAERISAVMSALARCRRLGASLADTLRLAGAAHAATANPTYGPRGDASIVAAQRTTGRAVDAHV